MLCNVSAPIRDVIGARLRGQEIVVRVDGVYQDRLSDAFIEQFQSSAVRWVLKRGRRSARLVGPLSDLANFANRNYGAIGRCLLADRIIYQSEFSRRLWSRYFPSKTSTVILNGAHWNGRLGNGARLPETGAPIELLTVYDDWKPAKRIDDLVRFVSWCNQRAGVPVRLTILGFTGRFPSTFDRFVIEGMTRSSWIRLEKPYPMRQGWPEESVGHCHAYITFTYRDPCPNVVVEAMAAGLPVVAIRGGGVPEIVGDAGVLIDIDDDESGHFSAARFESDFPEIDFEATLRAVREVVSRLTAYRELVASRFRSVLDIGVIAGQYARFLERAS